GHGLLPQPHRPTTRRHGPCLPLRYRRRTGSHSAPHATAVPWPFSSATASAEGAQLNAPPSFCVLTIDSATTLRKALPGVKGENAVLPTQCAWKLHSSA